MPVLLRTSRELPPPQAYDAWLAVANVSPTLPGNKILADVAVRLEHAFDGIRDTWLGIGHDMGAEPSARFAHTPAAGSYGSDFGLMLAWDRLCAELEKEKDTILVVCDDPWLFRQLAGRNGVSAGTAPALWRRRLRLALRGVLSRISVALRMMMSSLSLVRWRAAAPSAASTILVYGHPGSTANGFDAYFGDLMREIPGLGRMMHTDCSIHRAKALAADGRTATLHSFGNPFFALRLLFTLWRPNAQGLNGPFGWLIKRAAAKENSGGGLAMNRWQAHCQGRWLKARRPKIVAWPWENHAWERAFCRSARDLGIRTIGYQHAVVGPHQFNFSPVSNPDGLDSLPDMIVCNGPAYRSQLAGLGIPENRLAIGGAFRIARPKYSHYDPKGPIYVAMSAIPGITRELMAAVSALAKKGRLFIIKDHPMYPYDFAETEAIRRTPNTIPEQTGISAVLYATGTPGLEGLLAGVPSFRLLPNHAVALDIMPNGVSAKAVAADALESALTAAGAPPKLSWDDVMASVDFDFWRNVLSTDKAGSGKAA